MIEIIGDMVGRFVVFGWTSIDFSNLLLALLLAVILYIFGVFIYKTIVS